MEGFVGDLSAALAYHDAGISLIPTRGKKPAVESWKRYQTERAPRDQVHEWFQSHDPGRGMGLICGPVSQGLVCVDFDGGKQFLLGFLGLVSNSLGEDFSNEHFSIVQTPREPAGFHVWLRVDIDEGHNRTLAYDSTGRVAIETREAGGYALAPGSGEKAHESGRPYRHMAGLTICELAGVDPIDDDTFSMLLTLASQLSEGEPAEQRAAREWRSASTVTEGGRNNYLASFAGALRRIGLDLEELTSALLVRNRIACTPPLDESEVATIARSIAKHAPDALAEAVATDHLAVAVEDDSELETASNDDPGLIPDELLVVPGFISDVVKFTLSQAHRPNPALAFAGALALQAHLAARKVQDRSGTQTNLYVLALAGSGVGKEVIRKTNRTVLEQAGHLERLVNKAASFEGLEDSLQVSPALLFQPDETHRFLEAAKSDGGGRYGAIVGLLLELFTSSGSAYCPRIKARGRDTQQPVPIYRPNLTFLGTSIPEHLYGALSERDFTEGLIGRMLVIESSPRAHLVTPVMADPPVEVLATAKTWIERRADEIDPRARVVLYTREADELARAVRVRADENYDESKARGDVMGVIAWSRTMELLSKLSLLYAVSAEPLHPKITRAAVEWAEAFVWHVTRRLLYRSGSLVAESEFERRCAKILQAVTDSPDGSLPHWKLLKRSKLKKRDFMEVVETLIERGDLLLKIEPIPTGSARRTYQRPRRGER